MSIISGSFSLLFFLFRNVADTVWKSHPGKGATRSGPSRLEACKAVENNPDVVIRDIGWKKEMERRKRSTIKIYHSVLCPIAWSVRAFSCAQGAAAAPKKRNYILLNVTGSRTRNHIPARERAFGQ